MSETPVVSNETCPFPGLLPFQEDDALYFFGRDRETAFLLNRLEQSRFLAVIGVSGSGKSSLVRAGVKPELRFADPPWTILEMRPGDGPREGLRDALGKEVPAHSFGLFDCLKDATGNILLIVDQFEEIFYYRKQGPAEEKAADLFVQQILRASGEPGSQIHVLITMRTDYLGQCALFRNLPEALNDAVYLVPRLARQEQEEAIRMPLSVSGIDIEAGVVDELLNCAESNRDELPVLQHLLKRLWEQRCSRNETGPVTWQDYEDTGRWEEAISEDARKVLDELAPTDLEAAKLVYKRITEKGTGERPVRTPCTFKALKQLIRKRTQTPLPEILQKFRDRDLLIWQGELDDDSRIDIAHECITWRWATLSNWIEEEDRDRRRLAFIDQTHSAGTPLAGAALAEAAAMLPRITDPWVSRYGLVARSLKEHISGSLRKDRIAHRRTLGILVIVAAAALFCLVSWVRAAMTSRDLEEKSIQLAEQRKKREASEAVQRTFAAYIGALNVYEDQNLEKLAMDLHSSGDTRGAKSVQSVLAGWQPLRLNPGAGDLATYDGQALAKLRQDFDDAVRAARSGDHIDAGKRRPATLAPRVDNNLGTPTFAESVLTPNPTSFFTPHPSDVAAFSILDSIPNLSPLAFPRSRGGTEPVLKLADALGASGPEAVRKITAAGQIVFHAVGSTGNAWSPRVPGQVADAMVRDFNDPAGSPKPSFLFHLGDVVNNFGERQYYYDQFYRPFRNYPAPILAIAGNHDGMLPPDSQETSLAAFLNNFCAVSFKNTTEAGGLKRTTQIQPGVYYTFEAPFVRIVALYSGTLGNPGVISSQNGQIASLTDVQLRFLEAALRRAKDDKFQGAVIIAVHHDAYSPRPVDPGRHAGSFFMNSEIDAVARRAGFWPHAVLSGHAHNYQRYTRSVDSTEVMYVVAGAGGSGLARVAAGLKLRTPYPLTAESRPNDTVVLDAFDDVDYSFLKMTVDADTLRMELEGDQKTREALDTVTIDLRSHRIVKSR